MVSSAQGDSDCILNVTDDMKCHDSINRQVQGFTVIFVTPFRFFSLAAGFFQETLRIRFEGVENFRFVVRNYSRVFKEVDISFVRDMLKLKPDVIGFSNYFWNIEENLKLAALAKTLLPGVSTVFGGPQVGDNNHASSLLKNNPCIDAILLGESDDTFPELVWSIFAGDETGGSACLVQANDDSTNAGSVPCCVNDLSTLPTVFYEGSEYVARHLSINDVIPLQTVRGCRQSCSYCLYGTSNLRLFPLDRIEKEIAFLCEKKVHNVRVCDSHFGGSKKRAMELFGIIEHHNSATAFYIYPDMKHIDQAYIKAASKANCKILSLGIETMDPVVSLEVNRSSEQQEFLNAFQIFRNERVIPQVDMMYGLPKQTVESFQKDLVRLRLERVNDVLFSPLMMFPGTRLDAQPKSESISVLDTPQRFGYDTSVGQDDYSLMIMSSMAFELLSRLNRVDYYIHSELCNGSRYEQSLKKWFASSIAENQIDILALCEELRSSSEYIRLNARPMAKSIVEILFKSMGDEIKQLEFLLDLALMDILEIAMLGRKDELARNIYPRPTSTRLVFPDEFVKSQWVLSEHAWLEAHPVPYCLAVKSENQMSEENTNQVFCVYFCLAGTIMFVSDQEFDFLKRFSKPGNLFDDENPYSTELMELAGKWSQSGVLREASTCTQKGAIS